MVLPWVPVTPIVRSRGRAGRRRPGRRAGRAPAAARVRRAAGTSAPTALGARRRRSAPRPLRPRGLRPVGRRRARGARQRGVEVAGRDAPRVEGHAGDRGAEVAATLRPRAVAGGSRAATSASEVADGRGTAVAAAGSRGSSVARHGREAIGPRPRAQVTTSSGSARASPRRGDAVATQRERHDLGERRAGRPSRRRRRCAGSGRRRRR